MKRKEMYLQQFFKESFSDGVIFVKMVLGKTCDNFERSFVDRNIKLYSTLDTIIFIKNIDEVIIIFGIKSIIGYNAEFLETFKLDMIEGMRLHIKQIGLVESKNKYIALARKIIDKINNVNFYFSYNDRYFILKIYDEIVIPLQNERKELNINFFNTVSWIKKFTPIISKNNDYKYAIFNLIRADFICNNLFLQGKNILKKTGNEFVLYLSIEEYLVLLPEKLNDYKMLYQNQLFFLICIIC